MIYSIDFSFAAETDADKAGEYYDRRVPGLSLRFFDDMHDTIRSVINQPFSFHIYNETLGIRRANLDIFPYAVYYSIDSGKFAVKILAVLGQKRSKSYIRRRMK